MLPESSDQMSVRHTDVCKLYQQHDGVSMGSPLAPILANFFLAHIENKLLGKQLDFHPKLYSRYVDDIFATFRLVSD